LRSRSRKGKEPKAAHDESTLKASSQKMLEKPKTKRRLGCIPTFFTPKKGATTMSVLKALLLRRKFTLLTVVGALTLLTASAAIAGSGVGGVFNLGKVNTVNAITKLVGSVAGTSLLIDNNSTDPAATALNLHVEAGRPPMKVDSDTKVTNLNADKLDGVDSTDLLPSDQVRADGSASSSPIDNFTQSSFTSIISKTFDAPSDGFVMISGSIGAQEDCSLAGMGDLTYRLKVDATPVTLDVFSYELSYPTECTDEELNIGDSGAATAVVPVSEGTHTISLEAREWGAGSYIYGRSVTSVFVPNGSAGPIPTLTTTSEATTANQNRN